MKLDFYSVNEMITFYSYVFQLDDQKVGDKIYELIELDDILLYKMEKKKINDWSKLIVDFIENKVLKHKALYEDAGSNEKITSIFKECFLSVHNSLGLKLAQNELLFCAFSCATSFFMSSPLKSNGLSI